VLNYMYKYVMGLEEWGLQREGENRLRMRESLCQIV
jgi:hypothetical protein